VPHPLKDHPLPGIDPRRLEQLSKAGLASLEDVVEAGPERLSELTGFDLKTCRALVRLSSSALAHQDPGVIELSPLRHEPGSGRLTRGLRTARSIERALSLVRKARSWASSAPKPLLERKRKTRRQLRKLLTRLESLQESVLSDGLSQHSHDHLSGELELFEATLEPLLGVPVKRKSLRRVRRLAKRVRQSLDTSP
jgi:hypothetical protein